MYNNLKIFSGTANIPLAEKIVGHLEVALGNVSLDRFADGEINIQYQENVRGHDVFIIQSTNQPAENFIELLMMIDAAKRSSAKRVTVVIPYFGYARQERKDAPRKSIAARLMVNLIETAGADRVIMLDLHTDTIQSFFSVETPADHIYLSYSFIPFLKEKIIKDPKKIIIVSPDVGGSKKARAFSERLPAQLAIVDKSRKEKNKINKMSLIGDVNGKNAILIDDITDTARTLCNAADLIIDEGANSVIAVCTHPVLSDTAITNIQNSKLSKIFLSDTICVPEEKKIEKIEFISCSELLAEAIKRTNREESLSTLIL